MTRPHVPVMAGEVLELVVFRTPCVLVDLTVGAGGHASEFLAASAPTGQVFASDRDERALSIAEAHLAEHGERVRFLHADSVRALEAYAAQGVRPDAILLDLGVSSMQLDDEERGFSLREDAPLDMRMDRTQKRTAADVINKSSTGKLERILREYGDESRSRKLAEAFVARRRERPFRTTGDLRRVIEDVLGHKGGRIHSATRTFQALRLEVNRERELLQQALPLALDVLAPGGRLVVIAFESGDDRVVKQGFKDAAEAGRGQVLTRRPLRPGRQEVGRNRRARSARLRAFEVTQD